MITLFIIVIIAYALVKLHKKQLYKHYFGKKSKVESKNFYDLDEALSITPELKKLFDEQVEDASNNRQSLNNPFK